MTKVHSCYHVTLSKMGNTYWKGNTLIAMLTGADLTFIMEFLDKCLTEFILHCNQLKHLVKKTEKMIFECKYK